MRQTYLIHCHSMRHGSCTEFSVSIISTIPTAIVTTCTIIMCSGALCFVHSIHWEMCGSYKIASKLLSYRIGWHFITQWFHLVVTNFCHGYLISISVFSSRYTINIVFWYTVWITGWDRVNTSICCVLIFGQYISKIHTQQIRRHSATIFSEIIIRHITWINSKLQLAIHKVMSFERHEKTK